MLYERKPSVFALEVGEADPGVRAISLRESQRLSEEQWLKDELLSYQSAGQPLWDGAEPIHIGRLIGDVAWNVGQPSQSGGGDDDGRLVYLGDRDSRGKNARIGDKIRELGSRLVQRPKQARSRRHCYFLGCFIINGRTGRLRLCLFS